MDALDVLCAQLTHYLFAIAKFLFYLRSVFRWHFHRVLTDIHKFKWPSIRSKVNQSMSYLPNQKNKEDALDAYDSSYVSPSQKIKEQKQHKLLL